MATKRTFLISNAREAEEIILKLRQRENMLRMERYAYAKKSAFAERPAQYQFYFCKFQVCDNQLAEISQQITLLVEFLPMPLNFPL